MHRTKGPRSNIHIHQNIRTAWKAASSAFFCVFLVSGCTSLGHEDRTIPQIAQKLNETPSEIAVVGSGELAIALEYMLVLHGLDVLASPVQAVQDSNTNTLVSKAVAQYVVNVTSTDLDMCVPEGSRQMHFSITMVDLVSNERVFAMNGDYGCKDTIVKRFEGWMFQQ